MINVLSVDNMRKSDSHTIESGTPGRELMMRAARGIYESVKDQNEGRWNSPVAIICGSGNNAGDGYALALLLHEDGVDCTIICVYDRFSDDGRYYFDRCVEAGVKIEKLSKRTVPFDTKYKTIVDCLLGTGFKGEVRPELKDVIEAINRSRSCVVSADINSGLNGDTGMTECCVRSDLTVSVGGFKPGHFLNMAKDVMKEKINCDIGIEPVDEPYRLIEAEDVAAIIGKRDNYSNKGTYGYTALIGGSTRYSGAIRLAYLANASMRSGAGVVKVALPSSIVHDVAGHILESTIFPLSATKVMSTKPKAQESDMIREDSQVAYVPDEIDELISNVRTVAFGMGIGTGGGAAKILEHLLVKFSGTLIVDADGLTLLSRMDKEMIRTASCDLVLTPHIKEFSRLTGKEISQILEDPVKNAMDYAKDTDTVVLLKGPSTIVTDGDKVYLTDRGCAGMATAGSGDVLSGILAAICCKEGPAKREDSLMRDEPARRGCIENGRVTDLAILVAAAAYINGAAGEIAEKRMGAVSMIAGDTVAAIPEVIKGLC